MKTSFLYGGSYLSDAHIEVPRNGEEQQRSVWYGVAGITNPHLVVLVEQLPRSGAEIPVTGTGSTQVVVDYPGLLVNYPGLRDLPDGESLLRFDVGGYEVLQSSLTLGANVAHGVFFLGGGHVVVHPKMVRTFPSMTFQKASASV